MERVSGTHGRQVQGMNSGSVSTREDRGNHSASRAMMKAGLGGIVVLLVLALGVTYAVIEVKSGLRAYVTGESLWSNGTQEAVYYLDRYAETREERWLVLAREGLSVPLGDRRARLALEQDPPDIQAAREGFLAGRNPPEDVGRLIRMFRHFSEVSYFRRSVSIWREADEHILRLEELSGILEADMESPERLARIRNEIAGIQHELRLLAEAFSRTLGEADRWLNAVLFLVVGVVLGLAALMVMALFWWAARKLTLSERELWATLEHAGVGMVLVSNAGTVRSVNSRLSNILGHPVGSLVGVQLSDWPAFEEDPLRLGEVRADLDNGSGSVVQQRRCLRGDGALVQLQFTFSAVFASGNRLHDLVGVVEDVTEQHSRVERLSWEATHDPLTGVLNRREFSRRLEMICETSGREGARNVLCVIDLDRFKELNDSSGHSAGDEYLRTLCEIIDSHLREGDVLARLGGDEFAVVLQYCSLDSAREIAETLRRAVEEYVFTWQGRDFRITLSVGLMELGGGSSSRAELLEGADNACYEAKRRGRNRVFVLSREDVVGAETRQIAGGDPQR